MEDLKITVDEKNFEAGIREILSKIRPNWTKEKIQFKTFTDGITNKLIGCFYDDPEKFIQEVLLVRIYGHNSELMIDRVAEKKNMAILFKAGLAPQLYATFQNGLVYDYIPGVTLNYKNVNDPKVWKLVAANMAKMHKLPLTPEYSEKEPMLKTSFIKFLDLVPEVFSNPANQQRVAATLPTKAKLREEFNELYAVLEAAKSPLVFCHNDLLLGNVVYTEERNSVTFIDYEYADVNFRDFDIGNHFAEFPGVDDNGIDYSKYPSPDYQRAWIRVYLEEYKESAVTNDEVETMYKNANKFALSSHFLWALWSLIQAEHSTIHFDFVSFAALRYNEYAARKETFLNL